MVEKNSGRKDRCVFTGFRGKPVTRFQEAAILLFEEHPNRITDESLSQIERHYCSLEAEKFTDFVLCLRRHLIFLVLPDIGHNIPCSSDFIVNLFGMR